MILLKLTLIVTISLTLLSTSLAFTTERSWKCRGTHNDIETIYVDEKCMSSCKIMHLYEPFSDEVGDTINKDHKREKNLTSDIDNVNAALLLVKQSKIKCEHNETAIHLASTKCVLDPGTVPVASYVFYLIGFIMLFLVALIIILGILLYRFKMNEYKVFLPSVTPNTTLNVDVARKYIRQSSQELNIMNINSESKADTISRDCEIYDSPEIITPPKNQLKIYRSVKKPVNHQMLLREQMKKICEDALTKSQNCGLTASLKDLNQLLNEFDNENHEKSHESIVREKSASYPQLDIYDEPPAKIKPVVESEVDIPVYDCLPTSNNVIVKDYETNYLMALSKNPLSDNTEPAYINAKYRSKQF